MWGVPRWRPGRFLLLLAGPALAAGPVFVAGLATLLTALALLDPVPAALAASAGSAKTGASPPPPIPADLDPKYRAWLEEVAPLIGERERAVFLALTRDYQRDDFIQRFWDVRDPFPQTPRNELRDAWEERLKAARERFGNVVEDRARVLLIHGEPGHVYHSRCPDVVLPLEVWSYDHTPRIRRGFAVVFVQSMGAEHGRYRLWPPSEGLASLLTLEARARNPSQADFSALSGCPEGSEIAGYLSGAIDETQLEAGGQLLPRPSDEWLSSFAAASTDLPPGAQPLPAELEISFPGRAGSRTVVQGLLRVPRDATAPQRIEDHSFYSFLIDGEVVHRDELFEHFRYRFNLPEAQALAIQPAAGGPAAAPEIPLVFQRYLRPGAYTLVLKLEDTGGKRFFRVERELEVPVAAAGAAVAAEPAAAAAAAASTAPITAAGAPAPGNATPVAGMAASSSANGATGAAAVPATTAAALAEANRSIRSGDQSVRLLAPAEGLLTGSVRVDAVVDGGGIDHVRFLLDGRPELIKKRPPFSVDLNLGPQPRTHVIRAVAEAASGKSLAEDQIVLNAGPHRFGVRLLEPQAGRHYAASVRAEAKVDVPEGEKLDRVEFYRDDTLVTTLYQPPWTQIILLPETGKLSFVRVVAYLPDGNSSEDLTLVNSPNAGERIDVQMVELYTTVTDRRGRPVDRLSREDFKVYEDGVAQTVRRYERVQDLPIYAGVLLDTSGSMVDNLDTAVQAAQRFFQTIIQPKDRAAVITFSGQPNLAVRFTNDREVLAGGLAGLRADGNTALYDSIIYALYYFGGVRGKRAIVLLTDGKDEGSRFHYTDALEYAKHSGIAFYTIGLGQIAKQPDIRMKLAQIAAETGGRSYFIDRAVELSGTYRSIETELRSQYLLAYQSSKQGTDGKFRTVEVKLNRPGLEARTVPGYYP
ncbi:MAG TPA: VWA domain-containing protein [Thermoanaerobaculia bacterium]|nr:VWA domain-containing protein [Thermoanaerobaculia bacterium]